MDIEHFDKIDQSNTEVEFSECNRFRKFLKVSYIGRENGKTLCIIGQNPSNANRDIADKTIYFIEKYIYENFEYISTIYFLNLYSRVDTDKSEIENLEHDTFDSFMLNALSDFELFLIIYGVLIDEDYYKFLEKARIIKPLLTDKVLLKFDIEDNSNYAPHPGNPKIIYNNYDLNTKRYFMEDIK